jgi:hypothetical protein
MKLHRLFRRFCLMNALDEGGGGGGAIDTSVPVEVVTPDAAVVPDTPVVDASPAPKSMLDAMFPETKPTEAPSGQPRDEAGRFAAKVAADAAAAALAGAKPAVPGAPVVPAAKPVADDLKMPDGLKAEAQQRFQALANEVKELRPLREKADMLDRQVSYVKETFHQHQVQPEQFQQAVSVIGMINTGDYAGAMGVLREQMQQLALLTGEPLAAAIDPLEKFPDLRAKVDGLQITEKDAIELARNRWQQGLVEQRTQQQRQQEDTQAQQAKLVEGAVGQVDQFVKQKALSDIDYPVIEEILLPQVQQVMANAHPSQWRGLIETLYNTIKATAGRGRQAQPAAAAGNLLRPSGASSAQAAPRDGYEAMWRQPRPAGA